MPAVRLTDVARDAGVSLATASRVLNGSARVPGKDVAEKVQLSAAKLGYVTNAQAQALARSRSGLVGLVVHDISDPYFATLARKIQQQVFASGTQVLLTQTDRDAETESRAIRSLIAQRVDALVLVGTSSYGISSDQGLMALLEGFDRNGGMVIGIGQPQGVGRTIDVGDATGAHELATALVVEGHHRFAVVGSHGPVPSAAHRTGGFLAGLAEAGIEAELSVEATLDRDGGHVLARAVAAHLREVPGEGPLCVFAPADVMALGAIGELRRAGLEVPRDVAVAGFGGVPDGLDAQPTLTTLALPLQEIAARAVQWALEAEDGDGAAARETGSLGAAARETGAVSAAGTVGPAGTVGAADTTRATDVWTVAGEVALRESTERSTQA